MRRILALLPLCLSVFVGRAWCDAGAATYNVDPTTWPTIQPTVTSADTVNFSGTLAGPQTVSAGTLNNMAVTSASTDSNTGTVRIGGSVTLLRPYITNTSTTSGRCLYNSTGVTFYSEKGKYESSSQQNSPFTFSDATIGTWENNTIAARGLTATAGALVILNNISSSMTGNLLIGNLSCIGINIIPGKAGCKIQSNDIVSCGIAIRSDDIYIGKNNLFYNCANYFQGAASVTCSTYTAAPVDVSTWGAGCVSFYGSPFYGTPTADNPWTWRTGPWFPGNFAGVPLPTVPEVATEWYDASAGTETAPMTQGVADGVTYIYSTAAYSGQKSFTVNVPEAGTYKISASVSAPNTDHNSLYVRVGSVADVNTGSLSDAFVIVGVGQGFHEEDVTTSAGGRNTRYWNLSAGNVLVIWAGLKTNTALASFRLVKVGNPDILGRERRVPASTIGAVEYYPRPVPDDPFRWMSE